MKNVNAFIEEACALFESYTIFDGEKVKKLKLSRCDNSFVGIGGEYYLNRILNGELYQHYFDIVILIDKTNHFIIPIVWLPNEKKPYGFEHMYSDNTCCLGLTHEIILIWGKEQSAKDFFEKIVDIFLINLISYRNTKRCATPDRPHGEQGILEYYGEILDIRLDKCLKALNYIYDKVKRGIVAKGHHLCPCESGKRMRECHGQKIYSFINDLNNNPELKAGFFLDVRFIIDKRG